MLKKLLLYIAFSFSILSISGPSLAVSLSSHEKEYNAKAMERQDSGNKIKRFECSNENIGGVAACILMQYDEIFNLLMALPFVIGSWFGVKAAISLKDHNENPQQTPLKRPLMYLVMSGCMLSLPEFAGMTVNTFFDGATRAYPISLSE